MRILPCLSLLAALGSAAAQGAPKETRLNHVPDQLIVGFTQSFAPQAKAHLLTALDAQVRHTFHSNGAMLLTLPTKGSSDQLAKTAAWIRQQPGVAYVEFNTILRAYDAVIPDDPRFGELYGMHNSGNGGTVDADIDAPEAWATTTGSKNVLVAVIDTGIDTNHPDLAGNAWTNPGESGTDAEGRDRRNNGIDDDGNGYIDDWHGWDFANGDNNPMDDNKHGTHCAGTIGAVGNNGIGVAGVAWNVSLVGLKFLTGSGSGSLDNAVKAIEYATALGVDVMSNSWGGGGYSETMAAAIRKAGERGILFVAAAGNESNNNDANPAYPASYALENVISVAATDNKDGLASFSNRGLRTVHLGAPGVDTLSTIPNGGYAKLSGTSMATPHVSGAAALVKSAFPRLSAAGIKARLLSSAESVRSLQGRTITGDRLNVAGALENDDVAPSAPSALTVLDPTLTGFSLEWLRAGDDGDLGRAARYEARMATSPIESEDAWQKAQPVGLAFAAASDDARMRGAIQGLALNSVGFVAMRAFDNVGNASPLSPSVPFSVKTVETLWEHDADTLDGAVATASWGVEAIAGRGNVFSDSPGGNYRDGSDATLTLGEIAVAGNDLLLSFEHKLDTEKNYDVASVEVSSDGGQTWKQAMEFTGTLAWRTQLVPLKSLVAEDARGISVRFRFKSDASINYDGWMIDNVKILAGGR